MFLKGLYSRGKGAIFVALCLSIFGVVTSASADVEYDWVKTVGGTSQDGAYSVAVDPSGNVYVGGRFQGTADFDPGAGTDNKTSAGGNDAYLSKYDASGNYQWTKTFGGTSSDEATSVAVDESGNVYIVGYFMDTVDFDPGAGTDMRTCAGYVDVYLSKYDASGNYQWTKAFGGMDEDYAQSVATDESGNVYVGGFFSGTTDFDPGSGVDNRTSAMSSAFLSKYDASGNYQWTKAFGEEVWGYYVVAYSVATDASGNVYVGGWFQGTGDFDPGAGTDEKTSAGYVDVYLSKYDASGNYQWTKAFGGMEFDEPSSVATDASGNVYVGGWFQGTADFDPGAGTDEKTSAGGNDAYLSKYDASGNYQWTKTFGGTSSDEATSVAVDESGNVYVGGWFQGTGDFDPGAGTDEKTSAGYSDVFLSKYNASGDYQWTKTFGGTISDEATSVAVDESGNVYIVGYFMGTADFDPGAGVDSRTSVGSVDAFLITFSRRSRNGSCGSSNGVSFSETPSTNLCNVGLAGTVNGSGPWSWTCSGVNGGSNATCSANYESGNEGGGINPTYFYNKFNTQLDINATISLGCDPSVTMNALVGTGRSTINENNRADCTVITNNSAGYALSWQASTDDLLNPQSDHFTAYSPAASTTPETWDIPNTASAWGAKLASTSEGYNDGSGGSGYTYPGTGWGSDDSYGSGLWLNVAASEPFQFMQKATETDVDGEVQSLMFGAEIGADKLQPTGTYTTNVTVTAVTLSGGGGGGVGEGGIDEFGCTFHNAEYGDTINGTLDTGDCQEDPYGPGYYDEKILFFGDSGDRITLDATWDSSTGYLILVDDSDDSIVWEDGDPNSPASYDSGGITLPTTGSYTLWVTTYDPDQTGDYSVTIQEYVWGGIDEFGCTFHNAEYGDMINGTLDTGDCQEGPGGPGYYDEKILFSGESGDDILLDADWDSSTGYLILVDDSDDSIVWEDGDPNSPASYDSSIITLPTTGSYTLWVRTYDLGQTGGYMVYLREHLPF